MLVSHLSKVVGAIGALTLISGSAFAQSSLQPLGTIGGTLPGSFGVSSSVSMSSEYATKKYGTGSVSSTYTDSSPVIVPFTGKPAGLGINESLTPTNCPVNVHNPSGGKVLGCYSVVKPRPPVMVQRAVRVVRPIIYVRYPVPVAVPGCTRTVVNYSRYNHANYGHSYGRCGW